VKAEAACGSTLTTRPAADSKKMNSDRPIKGENTMAEVAVERKEHTDLAQSENGRGLTLTPRVDILETNDDMLLCVDLPGVKPEDVDIRFENGELILHGRRAARHGGQPWLWEYEVANFHRAFRVTENIAADKIHADLKNGVLTVRLPKVEAAKPRRITVKGE